MLNVVLMSVVAPLLISSLAVPVGLEPVTLGWRGKYSTTSVTRLDEILLHGYFLLEHLFYIFW
jgi:hypothetical protein